MKPEFGNLAQIEMLRKDRENEAMFEAAVKGTVKIVGTRTEEVCGDCGAPIWHEAEWITTAKGRMQICGECRSVIEIKSN